MKYVLGYSILSRLNRPVDKCEIIKLFKAINGVYSDESLDLLLSKVDGKDFNKLLEEGKEKMTSISVAAAPVQNEAVPVAAVKKEEEPAEEVEVDLFDFF